MTLYHHPAGTAVTIRYAHGDTDAGRLTSAG